MTITPQLILALVPGHPNPQVCAAKLDAAAVRFGIVSKPAQAMFVAQLAHESGFIPQEENLSYRAARICQVWPGRFPTLASAQPFAFNPEALGNRVYGGRMGNSATEGYRNRGRGMVQTTGHDNLVNTSRWIGIDVYANPDLLLQYGVSSLAAAAFWTAHGLNAPAERGDVAAVTRGINGGLVGLDDRERLYQRAVRALPRFGLLGAPEPTLDPTADAAADLAERQAAFERALVAA